MPTGYTAAVADGTIADLKTFALRLARGMGALVMMRDDPWDAPIPDEFKPSTYNRERLRESMDERDRIRRMSEAQCENEVQVLTQAYYDGEAEAREKHEETKQRYLDMIAKVEAWQGAPEGIKEFALEQLNSGMRFDCREPFSYWATLPDADPENWREEKLAQLEKDIIYHAAEYDKECERVAARNAWIKQLKESL